MFQYIFSVSVHCDESAETAVHTPPATENVFSLSVHWQRALSPMNLVVSGHFEHLDVDVSQYI